MMLTSRIKAAFIAFLIHVLLSLLIAAVVAGVVFLFWFPFPYRSLLGGKHLFLILIGVDIICGPVLTLLLFNPTKSRGELILDISLIAIIQIVALLFGLYSLALARPVVIAFETDRFVAVSRIQIDMSNLPQAPKEFQSLSWSGPKLAGTRSARDGDEKFNSIVMSLEGVEPSARPNWWQSYELNRLAVVQRMKKLSELYGLIDSSKRRELNESVRQTDYSLDQLSYLPLVSEKELDGWIVLLNSHGSIVGFSEVSGFQ